MPFRFVDSPLRLGAAAVVLQEQDQRVVEELLFFELGDDSSDALVHAVDHGGVDFHHRASHALCSTWSQLPNDGVGGQSGRVSPSWRSRSKRALRMGS